MTGADFTSKPPGVHSVRSARPARVRYVRRHRRGQTAGSRSGRLGWNITPLFPEDRRPCSEVLGQPSATCRRSPSSEGRSSRFPKSPSAADPEHRRGDHQRGLRRRRQLRRAVHERLHRALQHDRESRSSLSTAGRCSTSRRRERRLDEAPTSPARSPPNGHYLIQQAAGAGGTLALPTPNATGTVATRREPLASSPWSTTRRADCSDCAGDRTCSVGLTAGTRRRRLRHDRQHVRRRLVRRRRRATRNSASRPAAHTNTWNNTTDFSARPALAGTAAARTGRGRRAESTIARGPGGR